MPEKTPTTTKSTAGYVDPRKGVFGGVTTGTGNLNTLVNQRISNRLGLQLLIFHFTSMSNGDTWTSNIKNIVAVAMQPEDANDDGSTAFLTAQTTGTITIQAGTSTSGWLWIMVGAAANSPP